MSAVARCPKSNPPLRTGGRCLPVTKTRDGLARKRTSTGMNSGNPQPQHGLFPAGGSDRSNKPCGATPEREFDRGWAATVSASCTAAALTAPIHSSGRTCPPPGRTLRHRSNRRRASAMPSTCVRRRVGRPRPKSKSGPMNSSLTHRKIHARFPKPHSLILHFDFKLIGMSFVPACTVT